MLDKARELLGRMTLPELMIAAVFGAFIGFLIGRYNR